MCVPCVCARRRTTTRHTHGCSALALSTSSVHTPDCLLSKPNTPTLFMSDSAPAVEQGLAPHHLQSCKSASSQVDSNTVSTRHTSLTACFLSLWRLRKRLLPHCLKLQKEIHGLLPVSLATSTCTGTSSFLHSTLTISLAPLLLSQISLGPACAVSRRRFGTPSESCVCSSREELAVTCSYSLFIRPPGTFARCVPQTHTHTTLSDNRTFTCQALSPNEAFDVSVSTTFSRSSLGPYRVQDHRQEQPCNHNKKEPPLEDLVRERLKPNAYDVIEASVAHTQNRVVRRGARGRPSVLQRAATIPSSLRSKKKKTPSAPQVVDLVRIHQKHRHSC